jgi:hypothetical protein
MKVKQSELERFVALTKEAQYDYFNKEEYRRLGRKLLKAIAELLELKKEDFDIRWNPGGIACSGDHTLHTDWFYLALHDNLGSGWFYYRTCKSRKDYSGGTNRIFYWDRLMKMGLNMLAADIIRDCPRPDLIAA